MTVTVTVTVTLTDSDSAGAVTAARPAPGPAAAHDITRHGHCDPSHVRGPRRRPGAQRALLVLRLGNRELCHLLTEIHLKSQFLRAPSHGLLAISSVAAMIPADASESQVEH